MTILKIILQDRTTLCKCLSGCQIDRMVMLFKLTCIYIMVLQFDLPNKELRIMTLHEIVVGLN